MHNCIYNYIIISNIYNIYIYIIYVYIYIIIYAYFCVCCVCWSWLSRCLVFRQQPVKMFRLLIGDHFVFVVYVGQGCQDASSLGNNLSRCFVF